VALNTFLRHLWYLNETLIGLALFDDEVQVDSKELMVAALSLEGIAERCKRRPIQMEHKDIGIRKSSHTRLPPHTFFGVEIKLWLHSGSVQCQGGKAVNDAAEHDISLIQSFNAAITNQEEQKQFLLQVVEKHRLDYPDQKKSTLAGCSSDN